MKKRIVTATVAAALFMGSLAGCGGSSEPSAGSGSQASSSGSGSGKETITMWHALADNELEIFRSTWMNSTPRASWQKWNWSIPRRMSTSSS